MEHRESKSLNPGSPIRAQGALRTFVNRQRIRGLPALTLAYLSPAQVPPSQRLKGWGNCQADELSIISGKLAAAIHS